MFVPVNCTNCGKPFQVPEAALGKLAPCPWCQSVVTALPGSASQEPKAASAQEPLSLDDDPVPEPALQSATAKPVASPPEQKEKKPRATATVQEPKPAPVSTKRRWLHLVPLLAVGLLIMMTVTATTVGALKRKTGLFASAEWQTFHAPDGSCSVDLLGTPVEDPDAPANGYRRYQSEGWYSGTRTWVGWKDLTTVEAQMATGPDGWHLLRPAVFGPEKDRIKNTFGGYELEGGGTKSFAPVVVEYRFQTPEGLLVERIFVKDGLRPRVYFVGMVGKRLVPDGPDFDHLFTSFRVND